MSIGYTGGGSGRNRAVNWSSGLAGVNPSVSFRGVMPPPLQLNDQTDTFARDRFYVKNAWNCISCENPIRIGSPFRLATGISDMRSRLNYCDGSGPSGCFQSRPGLNGLRQSIGSNKFSPQSALYSPLQISDVPACAANVRFVPDSSDYITWKKKQQVKRNYNDVSNGGDQYSGSQVAFRSIRRF